MTGFFLTIGGALAMLLCSCGPSATAPDLTFLPARPEKGKLFRSYSPSGPSEWADNWTSRFDLTGVSWNDVRTATAISRNHVVMAAHFIRPASTSFVFHDRQGNAHYRAIIDVTSLTGLGDIAVAKLDRPLPPGVTHYPLAMTEDASPDRAVIVTDQDRQLSVHRIGSIQGRSVILGNDPDIPKAYWRNLVVGDSGNPGFIIKNGKLHLLTTHTSGGSGSGPFYGDPDIRQVLAAQP